MTGSFVTAHERATANGPVLAASPSPLSRAATWLTNAAIVALGASLLLLRAIVVGRGPWGNMFEFTVAFAFGIMAGYLVLERRYPIRSIGFLPLGVALGLFLYSWTLPAEIEALVPALQNPPLLTIHVGMAMISYGIFAMSFAAGLAYLVQEQRLADGRTVDRFAWLPSREILDAVAYRAVIVGFPVFATMIVLGSWWASIAWSRYWGWDPKETSALVTWLVYAVYLHLRNQRGWRGPPGGARPGGRVRDGPGDLLRQPLVPRPAQLQRALTLRDLHPDASPSRIAVTTVKATGVGRPTPDPRRDRPA